MEERRHLIAVPLLGELFPVVLYLTDDLASKWREQGYWVSLDGIQARAEFERMREVRNEVWVFPVPIPVNRW